MVDYILTIGASSSHNSINKKLANYTANLISGYQVKLISFAEHNGTYTAAFKNIMDWASRLEGKLWDGKPMLLLSTSPGGNGATTVLDAATKAFPYLGGDVVGAQSVPKFQENFSPSDGLNNTAINEGLVNKVQALQRSIEG